MSPGINDPRNTGTLPKSNRNRNKIRERDRYGDNGNVTHSRMSRPQSAQHSSNFRTTTTSETASTSRAAAVAAAKNSNTRTITYCVPTPGVEQYFVTDILPQSSTRNRLSSNLHRRVESFLKMTPPVDSRAQSPPNLSMKPTNTDKMPERGQVEGRLNQIREYIKVTSTMMDSLSQSTDPRAQAQHEKLSRMVEDLYDSEQKLSNLMETCQKYWRFNENGDLENGERSHEQELVKKIEESQRKLAQLQEHQAQLVGMQLSVRERLNEARQTQRLICANSDEDNEVVSDNEIREAGNAVNLGNVEQLEREAEALRDKLQQLENKKRNVDYLVQELQAFEVSERASCSSEGSRSTGRVIRDKTAELEAMKAQLKHLKSLMNDTMQGREADNEQNISEPEHDDDLVNNDVIIENDVNIDNSYNDLDEVRPKLVSDPPTVQQIHAVTRELKEQQQLLQTARAELKRLKQSSTNATPSVVSSPPTPMPTEKKQSNHVASNNDLRFMQNTRRQFEDLMRKVQSPAASVNQNGAPDWSSRRDSNSQHSHISTPANLWPPPTNIAPTHDHGMDAMAAADNLLEMGSRPPIMNGFGGNYWEMPNLMNQQAQGPNVGSAEYYRQLLLGSQALQLQMMSTTVQQCCQLVWNQQREMQSMKAAITQLQAQLRQSQSRTSNNLDLSEEHSNLGRAAAQQQQQQLYSSLDPATLPPSSSLPNLVSLPNTSPAPPSVASIPASCQQQQLNNQVPPGNRANNYWDNFRSYSRQNLLSGSTKTATDVSASASAQASSSANTATGITPHTNNKRNRRFDLEYLPSATVPDIQYSVNLQQERDSNTSEALPNNHVPNSNEQQQNHHIVDLPVNAANEAALCENEPCSKFLRKKIRSDVKALLKRLKALESRPENESPLPSNDDVSNSSISSDNESEAGARLNENASNNNGNVLVENNLPDCIEPSVAAQSYISSPLPEFLEHEFKDVLSYENDVNSLPLPVTLMMASNNDAAAKVELPKSENSINNQQFFDNGDLSENCIFPEIPLPVLIHSSDDDTDDGDPGYVMLERAHNIMTGRSKTTHH